jgi:AcrR family transcriptional regulator
MATASKTRTLSTAEERRETLIVAAMPVFGEHGFHAASTMEIAKAAGISQAYLFRLFPTKVDLFVAAYDEASRRMVDAFRRAADDAEREGAEPLEAMGQAYDALLATDRDVLLMQLAAQVAASGEPKIRRALRRCFRDIYEVVAERSGAGPEELQLWFAKGMLCNVMAAIDAEQVDEPWARALTQQMK